MSNTEIWKPIQNYENLYEISNLGKVKSVKRNNVLKQFLNGSDEYCVSLHSNGVRSDKLVKKLVAKHFVPNPHNMIWVRHIDNNKYNNNYSNLEWYFKGYKKPKVEIKKIYKCCICHKKLPKMPIRLKYQLGDNKETYRAFQTLHNYDFCDKCFKIFEEWINKHKED